MNEPNAAARPDGTAGVFKDTSGEAWRIQLDAVLIQEVREQLKIDIADTTKPDAWQRLETDVVLQVNTLHLLLAEQCQERGLTARDFAKRIGPGDVREHAFNALLDAIELFIPPARRSTWRALVNGHQEILERGMQLATEKVKNPETQARILEQMGAQMDSALESLATPSSSVTESPAN